MSLGISAHRSQSYKRPSSKLVKSVSDTLQPPAIAETDSKKQKVSMNVEKTSGSSLLNCLMSIRHGETTVSFRFEWMSTS